MIIKMDITGSSIVICTAKIQLDVKNSFYIMQNDKSRQNQKSKYSHFCLLSRIFENTVAPIDGRIDANISKEHLKIPG